MQELLCSKGAHATIISPFIVTSTCRISAAKQLRCTEKPHRERSLNFFPVSQQAESTLRHREKQRNSTNSNRYIFTFQQKLYALLCREKDLTESHSPPLPPRSYVEQTHEPSSQKRSITSVQRDHPAKPKPQCCADKNTFLLPHCHSAQ